MSYLVATVLTDVTVTRWASMSNGQTPASASATATASGMMATDETRWTRGMCNVEKRKSGDGDQIDRRKRKEERTRKNDDEMKNKCCFAE